MQSPIGEHKYPHCPLCSSPLASSVWPRLRASPLHPRALLALCSRLYTRASFARYSRACVRARVYSTTRAQKCIKGLCLAFCPRFFFVFFFTAAAASLLFSRAVRCMRQQRAREKLRGLWSSVSDARHTREKNVARQNSESLREISPHSTGMSSGFA